MSYEIIDKKLKIEACNIGDLTLDQMNGFLRLWDDGSTIDTLTLFLKKDGTVVLNKDNKNYGFYKELVFKFLKSNDDEKEILCEKMSKCCSETLKVFHRACSIRKTDELFRILDYNFAIVEGVSFDVLEKILCSYGGEGYGLHKIFTLGYIEGKRAERARRK